MATPALKHPPGFWRRFRIIPAAGRVCCEVEDDYHCMRVTVEHDGVRATAVAPHMRRAPWTTCPGAESELQATFTGVALADFPARGAKKQNCTHLYDLAELAAAHAMDPAPLVYDILVADPVEGRRQATIYRDGQRLFGWVEQQFELLEPVELAGRSLFDLREWLERQPADKREAARLLRWGTILANGRQIPLEQQSDAGKMPANCYTFQPQRAAQAKRIGEIRDFSTRPEQPLDGYQAFA